jgi:hypothetical protein
LRRDGRKIQAPDSSSWSWSFEFFVPNHEPDVLRLIMEQWAVQTVDAQQEESPLAIQLKLTKRLENRRKEHELALAGRFEDGRLLVDGGIGEAMQRLPQDAFVVGLVKSHQRQYFKSQDRRKLVLGMRAGQRTSVFLRGGTQNQGRDAYSFYLKMRDGSQQAPTFGLARIEMPSEERFLRAADDIAAWILHERAPLSLPDPRFHVLPYPIHLVEEHLKARQPSVASVMGLLNA